MKSFLTLRKGGNEAGVVALVAVCILLLAGFRVLRAGLLPELPNFSPVAAVAFCGGLFLPGVLAWVVPFGILFVSDLALAMLLGYSAFSSAQFVSWACILVVVGIGRLLSNASFSTPRFFFRFDRQWTLFLPRDQYRRVDRKSLVSERLGRALDVAHHRIAWLSSFLDVLPQRACLGPHLWSVAFGGLGSGPSRREGKSPTPQSLIVGVFLSTKQKTRPFCGSGISS